MRKPRNILVSRKFLNDSISALTRAVQRERGVDNENAYLFLRGQLYGYKMLLYRANHKKSTGCKVKK
jgi:hypothetical protein